MATYTLTKITLNTRLSEETPCFAAVICADGKPIADVRNHGQGGDNETWARKGCEDALAAMETWAKSLPSTHDAELGTLESDLDSWIADQLDQWEASKMFRRTVKRCILFIRDGKLFEVKWKGVRAITAEHMAKFRAKHPDVRTLNEMPESEALPLFISGGKA